MKFGHRTGCIEESGLLPHGELTKFIDFFSIYKILEKKLSRPVNYYND